MRPVAPALSAEPTGEAAPRSYRFRAEVAIMFSCRAAAMVLGATQSIIIARALGPSGRGAIAAAVGLAMILAQLGSLGMTNGNAVLVARHAVRADALVAASAWVCAAAAVVLAGAGLVVRVAAPAALQGVTGLALALALGALPFMLVNTALQGILLGQGRTITFNALTVAAAAVPVATLLAARALATLAPTGVLAIALAAHVCTTVLSIAVIGRLPARRPDVGLMRSLVRAGMRLYAAMLLAFLVVRVDILLVNAYKGPETVGYYAVAVSFVDALILLPSVVGLGLFSRVVREQGTRLTARVLRASAIGLVPVCLLAAAVVPPLIDLLYGSTFHESRALFLWLVPGVYALGLTTVISQHYAARSFPGTLLAGWVGGLVLNIVLNVALLPGHGAYVAPLASSIAYCAVLVVHVWVIRRDGLAPASR